MEFIEYPKSLYKSMSDELVVQDAQEEKAARKSGYKDFSVVREAVDAAPAVTEEAAQA